MNIEKLEFKKSVLPQLLITVVLLILAPYAMSFKPSVGAYKTFTHIDTRGHNVDW